MRQLTRRVWDELLAVRTASDTVGGAAAPAATDVPLPTDMMLAVLLHVTVGLAAIAATYLAIEHLARRSSRAAWALAGAVVVAALVTFAVFSLSPS